MSARAHDDRRSWLDAVGEAGEAFNAGRATEVRKRHGAFYTPVPLAERVVAQALAAWDGSGRPRVLDPACGAGVFLAAAHARGADVLGVDADRDAVRLARRLARRAGVRRAIAHADFLDGQRGLPPDVIVGNPPYVRYHALGHARIRSLTERFETARGQFDLFAPIVERALQQLSPGGVLAFVLPSLFLRGPRYRTLRRFILEHARVVRVEEHGDGMFAGVQAPTCHVVLVRGHGAATPAVYALPSGRVLQVDVAGWAADPDARFAAVDATDAAWLAALESASTLGAHARIRRGYPAGRRHPAWRARREAGCVRCVAGEDLEPWRLRRARWLSPESAGWSRELGRAGGSRVLVRETGARLLAVVAQPEVHVTRTVYAIWPDDGLDAHVLAAILNSESAQRWTRLRCRAETGIFPKLRIGQLRELPLPDIPGGDARRLRALAQRRAAATGPVAMRLQRQIDARVAALYDR